jgi:aminoglycoside phosphotransferase (APT) family kinase protein
VLASHTPQDSLFDAVEEQVVRAGHARAGTPVRYASSNHAGAILFLGRSRLSGGVVARVPMTERGRRGCGANAAALAAIEKLAPAEPDIVPRLLLRGRADGREFFAESAAAGAPVPSAALRSPWGRDYFARAAAVLASLQAGTRREGERVEFERLVAELFAAAFRNLGRGALPPNVRAARDLAAAGAALPRVLSHGDYSPDNVLADRAGRVRGVIDWEFARPHGLPGVDLLYLLSKIESARTGLPLGPVFARKIFPLDLSPAERETCERYCETLGVPRAELPRMALLAWVQHVADHLECEAPYRFWPRIRRATDEALEAVPSLTR